MQMHKTNITVQYKDPPKPPAPGKKAGPWSIKDEDGVKYKAWADQAAMMDVGGEYSIGYTSEDYQGAPQHTIKEIRPLSAPTPSPAPRPALTNKPNGHADPEYDLKVGAQATYNGIVAPLATTAIARDITVDEKWIADLKFKCIVGHEMAWDRYRKWKAEKTLSARRPEPEFSDGLDDTF